MTCTPDELLKRPITPALLRRIAEAADGFRERRKRFFLVARFLPGADGAHEVQGPFENAQGLPNDLCLDIQAGKRGWFGPFEADGPPPNALFVDEIDIRTLKPDGSAGPEITAVPARKFDAIWWSRSALEKFAVPYYARMYGGDYVKALLARFGEDELQMIAHLPGTEYEGLDTAPVGVAARVSGVGFREEPQVEVLVPPGEWKSVGAGFLRISAGE